MTTNTVQLVEVITVGKQGPAGLSDGNKGDVTVSSNGTAVAINAGVIVDADINTDAEISVSKLADGSARQLLQTNTAGTGVEWASNIDVPGTLDVTGAATFDGSVSATTFTGALSGNSTTATTFQTARNINGVSFDGSADITITAVAGTLTGDTLKNTVVTSSLTSVGTLGSLTVTNNVSAGGVTGGAVVTSGSSTSDTQVYSAKRSDELYFNKSSLEEITSGEAWASNDTAVATTAALDARITDLVDDVGGFVPIANETSFPNANPDVNNGAGTIVSISLLSGNLTSNGSGVITIANGTVGNSTVTINGAGNSTTYSAGFGMLVETTSTLDTYTFHRLVPKATEVTTVSSKATEIGRLGTTAAIEDLGILGTTAIVSDMDTLADISSNITTVAGQVSPTNNLATVAGQISPTNNLSTVAGVASNITTVAGSIANVNTVATNISSVNDFSAKYRIASSAPGSNNDDGDLYYNTSTNLLYVYNGSSWDVATALNNSGGTITGNTRFTDNTQLQFGDATTPDLKIWHQTADNRSYIWEGGSGALCIQGSYVKIQSPQTDPTDASEAEVDLAVFKSDGACEFYYAGDSTAKLSTTSTGAKTTGKLEVEGGDVIIKAPDGGYRYFLTETGNDKSAQMSLYNSANSQKVRIAAGDGENDAATFFKGGKVGIGTDSPPELLTCISSTGLGIETSGYSLLSAANNERAASGSLRLGTGGGDTGFVLDYTDQGQTVATLRNMYVASNDSELTIQSPFITFDTGTSYTEALKLDSSQNATFAADVHIAKQKKIKFFDGSTQKGYTELDASNDIIHYAASGVEQVFYAGGNTNLTLASGTATFAGSVYVSSDSNKIYAGAENEMQIFHSGTDSIIKDTRNAGSVKIQADNFSVIDKDASQTMLAITESTATFAGTVTCTSLTETSDIALKTNIEPITNVLDKINQITGYRYDFTSSNSSSIGVIAQDVEKVFPELVHGEEGSKSLQYSGLIGALIESVKELSAKVAVLEAGS